MKYTLVKYALIFLCFFLCSFCKQPKHCQLADSIMSTYSQELAEKKHLFLQGFGGSMMNDLQKINVSYVCFNQFNIEEARNLYVEVAEEYLNRMNQDKQLRPYLHNYPCTLDNIDLMIGFEDENSKILENGYVALIFHGKKDEICYQGHKDDQFYNLHRESYSQSLELVKMEN